MKEKYEKKPVIRKPATKKALADVVDLSEDETSKKFANKKPAVKTESVDLPGASKKPKHPAAKKVVYDDNDDSGEDLSFSEDEAPKKPKRPATKKISDGDFDALSEDEAPKKPVKKPAAKRKSVDVVDLSDDEAPKKQKRPAEKKVDEDSDYENFSGNEAPKKPASKKPAAKKTLADVVNLSEDEVLTKPKRPAAKKVVYNDDDFDISDDEAPKKKKGKIVVSSDEDSDFFV